MDWDGTSDADSRRANAYYVRLKCRISRVQALPHLQRQEASVCLGWDGNAFQQRAMASNGVNGFWYRTSDNLSAIVAQSSQVDLHASLCPCGRTLEVFGESQSRRISIKDDRCYQVALWSIPTGISRLSYTRYSTQSYLSPSIISCILTAKQIGTLDSEQRS